MSDDKKLWMTYTGGLEDGSFKIEEAEDWELDEYDVLDMWTSDGGGEMYMTSYSKTSLEVAIAKELDDRVNKAILTRWEVLGR